MSNTKILYIQLVMSRLIEITDITAAFTNLGKKTLSCQD